MKVTATRNLELGDLIWDIDLDGTYSIVKLIVGQELDLNTLDYNDVVKSLKTGALKKALLNSWVTKTDSKALDGGAIEITNAKIVIGASATAVVITDIDGLPDGLTIALAQTVNLSTLCSREASAASVQLKAAIDAAKLTVSDVYTGATEDLGLAGVVADASAHTIATTGIHGVGASTIDSVANRDGAITTHSGLTTGTHGVGGSTVESASGSQSKVDTHSGLTTGVHGVGVGTVAKVADIAVDANLSVAGQDAISKKHSQNTDQYLDFGGGNQSTAADVADAVTKKHGVNDVNTSAEPSGAVGTHAALTATHGVAGTIAGLADIAVDANLSAAGQDAISKKHAQYSDLTKIVAYDSNVSIGGAANETLTVTGLGATDTILAVSQMTAGANSTTIIAWDTQAADSLKLYWTANPGAGAVVKVLVKKP